MVLKLKKKWLRFAMAACILSIAIITGAQMTMEKWDKVFEQSDKVDIQKVKFKNRYGIELVGDLYMPKNKTAEKLPAIAVSGPFGFGSLCPDNG